MWFQKDDWVNNYIWPESLLSVTLPSQELLRIFKFSLFHFLWLLGKQPNSLGHPTSTMIRAPSSSWHLSCHMPPPGQLCALCSGDTDSMSLNMSCDFSSPCLCTCYGFWNALKTHLYTHSDIMWLIRSQQCRVLTLTLSAVKKDMTVPSSLWSSECLWNLGPQSGVCTPAGSISLGLTDTQVSGPAIISTKLETLSMGPRSSV